MGAMQLVEWLDITYLPQLLRPNRVNILAVGSRREVKSSRAVALMSVLDFRDWHGEIMKTAEKVQDGRDRHGEALKETKKVPNEEDVLIRKTYFYRFIQEAAKKTGAQFYNFISDKITDIDEFFRHPIYGSMMPFSSGLETTFEREATQMIMRHVEDHPTVSSWSIQVDGQVQIKQAGIIAFVDTVGKITLNCDNDIYFAMIPGSTTEYKSLEDLLGQVSRIDGRDDQVRPSYVVSLFLNRPGGMHFCVLLQGETVNLSQGSVQTLPLKLARTGLLHSEMFLELPADTEVDWIVL